MESLKTSIYYRPIQVWNVSIYLEIRKKEEEARKKRREIILDLMVNHERGVTNYVTTM